MASPRTTSLPGFLTTRFGRRLFGVFVLSALLPITGLAVLAFVQVTDELHHQTERRLRFAARAAGMRVFERLGALEADLGAIDARPMQGPRAHALEPSRRKRLARGFRTVWVISSDRVFGLLGDRREPPHVDLRDREAVLVLERERDGSAIYLARRLQPTSQGPAVAVGEVDPDHLFDISHENALPPLSEFALFDSEYQILRSSWAGSLEDLGSLSSTLAEAESSLVERRVAGATFLMRARMIFLESSYGHPPWIVMVAEPKQLALAPIARFRTGFLLVVGGTVFLIALLTTGQIRRRLIPLEALREGTERIARREFDARVSVSSGDELEEVAGSFNAMAEQLRDHFESLGRLAEIDREILSAPEESRMVETLVIRANEIYPCDTVAVMISGSDEDSIPRFLWLAKGGVGETAVAPLSEEEQAELRRNPIQLRVQLDTTGPRYLSSLAERELTEAVVLPLLHGSTLLGLLAFCHGPGESVRDDRILYARQLADRFASALSDFRSRADNYALTHFDPLTGLPNRTLFEERVRQALVQARHRQEIAAVAVIELDGFKSFNSTVGNAEGDRLLLEVARRLSSPQVAATVGRLGGDDFGILLRDLRTEEGAHPVVSAVVTTASAPVRLARGGEYYPSFSAGLAVFPSHARNAESLVLRATAALDQAKSAGGGECRSYTSRLGDLARDRLSMESQLRRAVAGDELCNHYQPVVNLERGEIVGAEALIRWQHPQRGLVSPDEFIPLAEETGLISPIWEFAFRRACLDGARWREEGLAAIRVHVNLSGRQLQEGSVLGVVKRTLTETSFLPSSVGLELTESILMHADPSTLRTLEALRDLGIHLFIDDFGTGYSCLSYLSQFPIDMLKIDRSFVSGLPSDPSAVAISRAIIAMAAGLELGLVAEGVETAEQATFLRQNGCELAQGYLFSRSLPEDEFRALLGAPRFRL